MGKSNKKTGAKNYSEEQVLAAIENSYGIVSRVAERLVCDWNTADKYVKMYPLCVEAMAGENERVLDLAETKVIKAINLDDVASAKWLLSTKGKHRGYNTSIEHSGANGSQIEHRVVIISKHGADEGGNTP